MSVVKRVSIKNLCVYVKNVCPKETSIPVCLIKYLVIWKNYKFVSQESQKILDFLMQNENCENWSTLLIKFVSVTS